MIQGIEELEKELTVLATRASELRSFL